MSVRTLALNAQAGAARVGKGLGPGGDWEPMLFVRDYEDETHIVRLPGELLSTDEEKDEFMRVVYTTIVSLHGVECAFLTSAWLAFEDQGQSARPYAPPSERPDRVEVLWMLAGDIEGEMLCWQARIFRRSRMPGQEGKPYLGPWQELPEAATLSGRFAESIRLALSYMRQLAESPTSLLRVLADRDDLPDDGLFAELARLAEDDPSLPESMPIHQWWLRTHAK